MLSLFTANTDRQEIYQRILHSGYLDGVIVASTSLADPLIPDLLRDRIPFVSVERHPNKPVHNVDADNVSGARMAVEHLVRVGHRRISTITGPLDTIHGQARLTGYRQALQGRGTVAYQWTGDGPETVVVVNGSVFNYHQWDRQALPILHR